jgi:hypothetical protein
MRLGCDTQEAHGIGEASGLLGGRGLLHEGSAIWLRRLRLLR